MGIEKSILEELQNLQVYGDGPDGKPRVLATDTHGRLRVATGPAALLDKDWGALTTKLISPNPTYLVRVVFINRNAAVRFGNIHNKNTAPVATDVPALSLPIPAGTANNPGVLSIELGETWFLDVGLGWSISTVEGVFTNSATATEHTVHLWYASP
jgi:hypothetical protein